MKQFEALHPVANAKPKRFTAEPRRQGGSLAAHCGCGWYCMHNHKLVGQAEQCAERHADTYGE
jgi:hypothetical protein